MLDIIQKAIQAGIGATAVSAEKIESILGELVEKGKITAEEVKETARKIVDDGKTEFEKAKGDVQDSFKELLQKSNLVTKDQLESLEARVAKLEQATGAPSDASKDSEESASME